MLNSKVSKAVRLAIAFGAASTAAFSANTFANEDGAEKIERVQVTGSRIKRVDMEGAQQVVSLSKDDIIATGLVSIGDILQNLPSAGSAINTATNNSGDGSTRVSLRNLGSNRTLVLVNGRRWVASNGSVDLNSIPMAVVERIDVLKDGASSVYGSDAMVGVVNIITKKEFEGAEYSVRYGETAEGDGEKTKADFTIGMAGDKGNVVVNIAYTDQASIMAGDREFSNVPMYGTGNTRGSSGTPQGRFSVFSPDGEYTSVTLKDSFDPASGKPNLETDTLPFTDEVRYNYAPVNFLDTPSERTSIFVAANYEVSDDVFFDTQVFYTKRKSSRLLAPMPLFIGPWAGGLEAVSPTVIHKNNPYNPFGFDVFGEGDSAGAGFIGRRMIEGGGRLYTDDNNTFVFNSGFSGDFEFADRAFSWDVNYNFGELKNNIITDGLYNRTRIGNALGDPEICKTLTGCVPLNLFGGQGPNGEGSITPEMLSYIKTTQQTQSGSKNINYTANLSGEVFELPAGMVGFATGYEYRRVEGFNQPDYLVTSGQSTGNISQPTKGSFNESSYYLELALPLLEDLPFVESLDLSLAGRKTSYENSAGNKKDNTSMSAQLTYRVNSDLLVRSSFSEGFRVPTISNLFGGAGESFNTITDPCNGGEKANPTLPGCKGVSETYSQPNGQIRTVNVPNEALDPETSESTSFGIVYSPSFLDGFSASVDYFDVEIEKSITRYGGGVILRTCAESLILCDFVKRDSQGYILDLANGRVNAGGTFTKGVDWSLAYTLDTEYGKFRVQNSGTYVKSYVDVALNYVTQETTEIPRVGNQYGNYAVPRIKSNFTLNWSYEDFSVNWSSRYIHRQEESCANGSGTRSLTALGLCSDPQEVENDSTNKLGGTTYHDVSATYFLDSLVDNATITFGINNVFDKVAPISFTSTNSIDTSTYDFAGRAYYLRFSQSF